MTSTAFKIEVPQDYFARTAAREYADDAGLALVREFAQNSCDAGCTKFLLDFNTLASEGKVIAKDDGRGCDGKTLREKVLRPLESQKGEGAVGGFGKAKELLYFANEEWEIRTRDVLVRGRFLEVVEFVEGLEVVEGFAATVKFPTPLRAKAFVNALPFFRASERPGVTWLFNGAEIECEVTRAKRATKDFGFAKAYVTRDREDTYMYLRTKGLLTGKRYCYHPREVGQIVMEIVGESTDLLTPARDGFKSFDHRQAVDGWLNGLVTDYRRELADDEGDEVLFVEDETLVLAGEADEAVEPPPAVEPVAARIPSTDVLPTEGSSGMVSVGFLKIGGLESASGGKDVPGAMTPKTKHGFDFSLMPRLPGVSKTTVHTGSKKQSKEAMKWLRANKGSAERLLAAWTTSVRECCAATGLPVDFVGFTFMDTALAEFVKSGGRFALLVNPLLFKLADRHAVEEIIDLTVHELAHEATRGGHTEEWAMMEHAIRRKCRAPALRGAVARALRDGAVARSDD